VYEMRGRGIMLVAGMKMGQKKASQATALKEQGAAEAQQQMAQAPTALSPETDVTVQLQKFAELHKSGVLSDEEFTAAKKNLLGI